jgi:transcriptional regulator with XRE-family HTH domain
MSVAAVPADASFGALLRDWRTRRRWSQLQLATTAEVSTRHLSFLENGRARPSRELVLHLARHLDVPLRRCNELLLAAGFAPHYGERRLDADELDAVRRAVDQVLAGHEPYPALAVDRAWNVVRANRAAGLLAAGVAAEAMAPELNVARVTLHPKGMAPFLLNGPEVAADLVARLRREAELTADPRLDALLGEVASYPLVQASKPAARPGVVIPMRLRHGEDVLELFTTMTVFGSPADVTVDELAVESFFPADEPTAALLRRLADAG